MNLLVFLLCSQTEVDCKDARPAKLVGEGFQGALGMPFPLPVPCPERTHPTLCLWL